MTGSSPMSAAKGQPAAIVPATTQTPKAIIPTEIKNESTLSMIGPFLQSANNRWRGIFRLQTGRPESAPDGLLCPIFLSTRPHFSPERDLQIPGTGLQIQDTPLGRNGLRADELSRRAVPAPRRHIPPGLSL